jgi:hypothetical protein
MKENIEFEEVRRDLEALKKAVRGNNPLLRQVAGTRVFAALSAPFGAAIAAFGLWAHTATEGGKNPLPMTLTNAAWVLIAVFFLGGGFAKVILMRRAVRKLDHSGGFWTLVKILYGGKSARLIFSAALAMVAGIVFCLQKGAFWYIVPLSSVFIALAAEGLDIIVGFPEYKVLGIYSLLAGLAALFFVESSPWLWIAIVYGGMLLAFGIAGFLRLDEKSVRPAGRKSE